MKAITTQTRFYQALLLIIYFGCSSGEKGAMLLPFEESGRWGIINDMGEIVIDNDYKNKLLFMQEELAIEEVEGGYFFVDHNGKESIEKYMDVTELSEGLALVVKPDHYPEAVNSQLKSKFIIKADRVYSFCNGYARIQKGHEFGVINKRGEVVINPKYIFIDDFNEEGVATAIKEGDNIIYIDTDGEILLELSNSIQIARNFSEGMAAYYDEGWGFLDKNGEKVIRAKEGWKAVSDFHHGYATYLEEDRWGLIDMQGNKVIRAKYHFPIIFEDDVAPVALGEEDSRGRINNLKFGYIDTRDNKVIDFDFDWASPFITSQTIVKDGKYFYSIDKQGKQYSKNEFEEVDISAWAIDYYLEKGLNISDLVDGNYRTSSMTRRYRDGLKHKFVRSDHKENINTTESDEKKKETNTSEELFRSLSKFKVSNDGFEYKVVRNGTGRLPKQGDIMSYNMKYQDEKGFVIYKSEKDEPVLVNCDIGQWEDGGPFYKALKIIKEGDSILIRVQTKELFSKSFKATVPSNLNSDGMITFFIGANQIKTSSEIKNEELIKNESQTQRDVESIIKYLKDNDIFAKSTDSGLFYVIEEEGSGIYPKDGDRLEVHYTGTLLDGTKFDSSYDRDQTLSFTIGKNEVIAGWDEGLRYYKQGGKGSIYIPSPLAYGKRGAGGIIKPNSILKFDIEVVQIDNQN
jgi:FKBP-type peptidyl-prolyl cis-trans isomerase